MNSLDVEKARSELEKRVKGYTGVAISYFLKEQNSLLDIIDDLQKENESIKKQISSPIVKEKIVYRKR